MLSKMRLRFFLCQAPKVSFQCNICGGHVSAPLTVVSNREMGSCYGCGSNLRFRSIIAAFTQKLTGEVVPLSHYPGNKKIRGIGMSDADLYATPLAEKFSYKNTFYHQEPKLDATDLTTWKDNPVDFLISSDVFEHIPFPVDIAFYNLYKLLKNDGICIFSAPFNIDGKTEEHFPMLYKWSIDTVEGKKVLINERKDGVVEKFDKLCFHGGYGATLEMRKFCQSDIVSHLKTAGFREIQIHQQFPI